MRPGETKTKPPGGVESVLRQRYRDLLGEARERSLGLVAPVSDADLTRVHSSLMSPLAWDLGHIAAFEDLWLCRRAGGLDGLRPELDDVYDATETPRAGRGELTMLEPAEARTFMDDVRERALGVLDSAELDGGFLWEMIVEHEHQHNETMLQALALAEPGVFSPPPARALPAAPPFAPRGAVRVEGGPFLMGAEPDGFVYDNERPRHEVDVAEFEIDRAPVTNAAFLAFADDGGYARRELWSDEGWAWRESEGAERPLYWTADGRERRFDRTEPIDPRLPVMHVSWYEANAYARWAGKRLPSEAEWEKAAAWGPGFDEPRRFPWGDDDWTPERANLDQLGFGPAAVGAHPAGASGYGVLGLLGDCWEWTSTPFDGYRGFSAYPYREYSEIFFGSDYRVLRGASWATRPSVARNTFRNWDHPQRRQIFAGFRCVAS